MGKIALLATLAGKLNEGDIESETKLQQVDRSYILPISRSQIWLKYVNLWPLSIFFLLMYIYIYKQTNEE
jgi:hypothetical protein